MNLIDSFYFLSGVTSYIGLLFKKKWGVAIYFLIVLIFHVHFLIIGKWEAQLLIIPSFVLVFYFSFRRKNYPIVLVCNEALEKSDFVAPAAARFTKRSLSLQRPPLREYHPANSIRFRKLIGFVFLAVRILYLGSR